MLLLFAVIVVVIIETIQILYELHMAQRRLGCFSNGIVSLVLCRN